MKYTKNNTHWKKIVRIKGTKIIGVIHDGFDAKKVNCIEWMYNHPKIHFGVYGTYETVESLLNKGWRFMTPEEIENAK